MSEKFLLYVHQVCSKYGFFYQSDGVPSNLLSPHIYLGVHGVQWEVQMWQLVLCFQIFALNLNVSEQWHVLGACFSSRTVTKKALLSWDQNNHTASTTQPRRLWTCHFWTAAFNVAWQASLENEVTLKSSLRYGTGLLCLKETSQKSHCAHPSPWVHLK